jgi:hypothetical protein
MDGSCLFRVIDVFVLPVGRVVLVTDCPIRSVPKVRIGDPVEIRNPDGSVFHSIVAGIEFADPPRSDRTFTFSLPSGTPPDAMRMGAEVWSHAKEASTQNEFNSSYS